MQPVESIGNDKISTGSARVYVYKSVYKTCLQNIYSREIQFCGLIFFFRRSIISLTSAFVS